MADKKKRKYVKKSDYWQNRSLVSKGTSKATFERKKLDGQASFSEGGHYTSYAACGNRSSGGGRSYRNLDSETISDLEAYPNIRSGLIPFNSNGGSIYSVSQAIQLVYRAYFNVAVIRNAINLMMDFSASPIHVKSENATVKKFFESWLDAINIEGFAAKYFLEYYRSGNVFIYTFDGKIEKDKFDTLKTAFGAKSDKIPVRYIILNPMQVSFDSGVGDFVKALSTYEVERLKNPTNEEDIAVFNALPKEVKDQIKKGKVSDEIYLPLDPKRLHYTFYRKTDYEPMAIPMTYAVLNDVEDKLELKKMDMALARTIEQVILLVTTGEKADEYNAGLNNDNLQALQSIFQNQTIGRVLVADYTTKAEWKIPDLKDMLGKEKYERVDLDIKEGLQYVFFGDEKFASASIKSQIFIESLKEGRRCFFKDFLIPEAKKVAKAMGFKHLPKFEMESIEIENTAVRDKLFVQMAQLGLLTADELNTALDTGLLPEKMESVKNQKEYMKQRIDDNIYTPLLGGSDLGSQGDSSGNSGGRPDGATAPQTTKNISPVGTTKGKLSMANIIEATHKLNSLLNRVEARVKTKFKVKDDLTEQQASVVKTLAKSIAFNEPEDAWIKATTVTKYLKSPKPIPSEIASKVDDYAVKYDTSSWEAVILYFSDIKNSQ